jgi:hypothetical protein
VVSEGEYSSISSRKVDSRDAIFDVEKKKRFPALECGVNGEKKGEF